VLEAKPAILRYVRGLLRERLGESAAAFAEVFRNPGLRRVQLAWAGSVAGDWAYAVALAVYAYGAGGAAAVGLVGLIRFVPAAVAAPFAGIIADRFRRERVMLAADLVRAVALAAAAVAVFADAPPALVYVLAAVVSVVAMAFRPAQAAVLPSLARSPDELTAANVASTTIESVGSFAGPALGGFLLAATDAGVVFAVTAGTFLWSAALVSRISTKAREPRPAAGPGLLAEATAGFRAITSDSRLRVLTLLFSAQTLVAGALNVLIVVLALELLDVGDAGVGWLNAAVGAGGIAGAALALALVGRRRLAGDFGLGLILWGAPIALIAVFPDLVPALVLLAVVGVGNTIADIAGLTLLQRAIPDEVLARAFGVLESLWVGTIGLGAVLVPPLIAALGERGALLATGALLPVLAALYWRRLAAIDKEAPPATRELALLRAIPLFAPLPVPTIEHLARSLVPVRVEAGQAVLRQGEAGDRFFVIGSGRATITADGRSLRTLEAGDHFGEIALLRDVPRTASVTAQTELELYALERDEFVAAVTGHSASAEAADAVIGARLGSLRAGMASV
jgi:MFS family permease